MILYINKTTNKSIVESLELIGRDLILNKLIRINESCYSIIDLEIYYWHYNHPDEYTNAHKRPLGEFEIHRYGIDISLGNNNGVEYGGILIRGLFDMANNIIIKKPEVIRTIFNNITQGINRFELVNEKTSWNSIFHSKRLNLGNPNTMNKEKYHDALYKFMPANKQVLNKYPDKEHILRNSDLSDEDIHAFLDYNLTR